MKHFKALVILLLFINLSCQSQQHKQSSTDRSLFYKVTKVVDGDTFWIDNGTAKGERIRLIGLDAPEMRNTGKKTTTYYGKEAKDYLTNLLLGKEVCLEYDAGRKDRYGRTLAYVYLPDETFVNAELLKNGYATLMTIPPNVKYADEFLKLQQEARKEKRGLWEKPY